MVGASRKPTLGIKGFSTSHLCGICALVLIVIILSASRSLGAHSNIPSSTTMKPFSLLVKLNFTSSVHKEEFLQIFEPLARHVAANEPDTLAYEALLSDQDPLQLLILERYRDKENAYLKTHKSSAPFLEFRPKLLAMQQAGHVTVSGHSYLDAGIGFGDRS